MYVARIPSINPASISVIFETLGDYSILPEKKSSSLVGIRELPQCTFMPSFWQSESQAEMKQVGDGNDLLDLLQ